MFASEQFASILNCNESQIIDQDITIQNLNLSGFSNVSNDDVFVNQSLPPKYMESLIMKPVLEQDTNESFRHSQSSVKILPPRAQSKKKRAQSCQNLKYSHVPSKVKKFIDELPKESRKQTLTRHKSMPESALPWNQLVDNPFKDETDINILKQELCNKLIRIEDLEQKIQSQSAEYSQKLTELGLEMGLKRAEMNLKVNSIRNELSLYKEKEQVNSRTQSSTNLHSKLGSQSTSRVFLDTFTQTDPIVHVNPEYQGRSSGGTPNILMYSCMNKHEKRFDYINKNHNLIRELSYNQSDDEARHNNSLFQRSVTFNTSVMQNTTVFSSHASSENLIVEGIDIKDSSTLFSEHELANELTASIKNNESKRSKRSKIKKRLMNWICISK